MSYQRMDHAEWMRSNNHAINRRRARQSKPPLPEEFTEFQTKVIDIVGMVGGGIYNAPICGPESIDWEYGGTGVSLTWSREMATFDFVQLTMLVFLCHEARIRVQIEGVAPHRLRLSFWQRVSKEENDNTACWHPNLDEAVAMFRKYLPADHRIVYRPSPAQSANAPEPGSSDSAERSANE